MKKTSLECRKSFFDLLCRNSSPDFMKYLRAYEDLPRPQQESFEVSCELVNGRRIDRMRLAILGLRRADVLGWMSACGHPARFIDGLLFENTTDACFGIGLADYESGAGNCRIKAYNEYGTSQSQEKNVAHVRQLFTLLGISDIEFEKDVRRFGKIKLSAIDWGAKEEAIKVYFGPFYPEGMFTDFGQVLTKDDRVYYDLLREKGFSPERSQFSVNYSLKGRSLKMEMFFRSIEIVPFLKVFDQNKEVSRFFVDFYRHFPSVTLNVMSMQWLPVQKVQFYFKVGIDQ